MFKIDLKQDNLIIALGNPGKRYDNTWHNAGFIFADVLTGILEEQRLTINTKEKDEYLLTTISELKLHVLKPYSFMNNSGTPVKKFLKFKEIAAANILLVHDDLDISLGDYKLSLAKSPKAHNGVTSVERELGFKDFYRLRIGVETRVDRVMSGSDYVLSQISDEHYPKLVNTIKDTITKIL